MQTIEVNLDLPPKDRWHFAANYTQEINEIIACYWIDLEDYVELIESYLDAYKSLFIPSSYIEEIQCIANYCDYTADQILIANLYYDIVKFAFACTAFAFEKDDSIWHARNLDWWTENDVLKKYTKTFNYTKGGKTVFQSVGWVGFVGVLSGVKPNQFSITLNAIVSDEAPNMAKPITFLLREVLEGNSNFQQAQEILEQTEIICDCLLLVAGTTADEIIVIERTPRSSKTRYAENGFIIVTNDYKKIAYESKNQSALKDTSCGRYDKTKFLLKQELPSNTSDCFEILNNKAVKMQITVQQMVFNAKLGLVEVKNMS
jgi:hypothetical protein